METTQIYTHVHIEALREIHARTHPHGRLDETKDMYGPIPTAETPEHDLPSPPAENPLQPEAMWAATAPGPEVSAVQAGISNGSCPEPPDEEPPAGGSPCATPKPPSTGGPSSAKSPLDPHEPAQKSTEIQRFRPGVAYYGYRWFDPETGRWPSRDPIEEKGGVNLYGFLFNNPIFYYDYLGGNPQQSLSSRHPIRVVVGNVSSALTGDLFHGMSEIPSYDGKQCEFLITVSGIRMKNWDTQEDTQRDYHDRIRRLPGQKGIRNPAMVNNPSNGPRGAQDFIQIMANEMLLMTRPDLDMVRQIEAAAKKAKENKCCCWSIQVIAHSQGTMIFKRSLALINADTKKHIHFIGLGGQAILHSNMGLASVLNITHENDFVPKLQPNNWRYFREEINTDTNDAHSWRDTYLPYLKNNPSKTRKGKICD